MNTFKTFASFILSICVLALQAQTPTFETLHDIMQVKCTGCHGGASPQGNLDLSGTQQEVYNLLVDANPTNPSAMNKGYKLAMPGYPERSYLLHKLSENGWDDTFGLEVADGDRMPPDPLAALDKKDIELFRQWILFGAPMNEKVVEPAILESYYNGTALPTTPAPAPPEVSEGYQLRMGPFFLAPGEEREYFLKKNLGISETYEINEMDVRFNNESHHFLFYQMGTGTANSYPEGLRSVDDYPQSMFQNSMIGVWQDEGGYKLPDHTAYKVNGGNYIDMNYHVKNYDDTNVLAAQVYINVFTQPEGTAIKEMYSDLFPISFFQTLLGQPLGSGLVIPPGGDEVTFSEYLWMPDIVQLPYPTGTWHIWQLSTHTHARGTDYDVYIAEDQFGTKGEKLYEGFYNYDYTFDQGYYDWEHPAIRYFEPMKPVFMGAGGGLIHEAKYINNTDETLGWGNTTNEEMMLLFVHYTDGPVPTSIEEVSLVETHNFAVYPNPYQGECNIRYQLSGKEDVVLEVHDLLGNRVKQYVNGTQPAGNYEQVFSAKELGLPNGMYIVRLSVGGESASQKIVEMR